MAVGKFAITYQPVGFQKRRLLGQDGRATSIREKARRFETREAAEGEALMLDPSAKVVELR